MAANRNADFLTPLPTSDQEALEWLTPVLDFGSKQLQEMQLPQFKKAWYSVAFLYSGLHPDAALEHGNAIVDQHEQICFTEGIDERLRGPYYEGSGWPVILESLANEAWRRYEAGLLEDHEFYCADAQRSGMIHRSPHLVS